MWRKTFFLGMIIFGCGTTTYAQLPYAFTNTARNTHYGIALDVAVAGDGTVFVANGHGGLRAYTYDGETITRVTFIDDGGYARGLTIAPDGTIFLANDDDGLRAYTYDGNTFTNTAHIDDGGNVHNVEVGPDGTIFLAKGDDGLRAYSYDGASFTNTAHISNGSRAQGVAVAADGTVFLANGQDGLRAYSYNGSSFINTAHIDDGFGADDAVAIAVASDGTIFLANERDGLRAYTYGGNTFINTAHIDNGGNAYNVEVGPDGTIFLANRSDGLWVYTYDGSSFTNTDHINDGGSAQGVAVDSVGTVFLANGNDGLRAYHYDGTSVMNTAHIADVGEASSVAVGPDGTVFVADAGLFAYSYDGSSFTNTAYFTNTNVTFFTFNLAVDAQGIVFLRVGYLFGSTFYQIYSYDGTSFSRFNASLHRGDIAFGPDGTIFISYGGLSAYTREDTIFTNTAHTDNGGGYIAVAPDGTIFQASDDSLWAWTYDGSSFTNTAQIDISLDAADVAVGADGTVFLALATRDRGGWDNTHLSAYSFNDTSFTNTANIVVGGEDNSAIKVEVGPDGTIFLANGTDGLRAYTYDGSSFTNTAHRDDIVPIDDIAVSSDETIFLVSDGGLYAYAYTKNPTSIDVEPSELPTQIGLMQNYPNPFNPTTAIEFSLPQSGFVTVKVYNLLGEEVATLLEARKPAGRHNVSFDALALTSGLYYYTLTVGDPSTGSGQAFKQTRKMLLLR
ncbi:T9SS type A sorting domain-containing protein [bacterium]|nr:T9SS type A sorting domain-containing protein [bacterium]